MAERKTMSTFNRTTLVKVLEEKGIGRPSTYAAILTVIQNREYVEKTQGRFYPTELGMVVCELLVKNFSDIPCKWSYSSLRRSRMMRP